MGLWDLLSGNPEPNKGWLGMGQTYSYDWCRYRMYSHCYLGPVDPVASDAAGYAVRSPRDRGNCSRVRWQDQQQCPMSLPGPRVPGGLVQATVPWESGGQRLQPTEAERRYVPPSAPARSTSGTPDETQAEQVMADATRLRRDLEALGHLIALRTAGWLDEAMFNQIRARLHPGAGSPVSALEPPPGTPIAIRVVDLEKMGVLTSSELTYLRRT